MRKVSQAEKDRRAEIILIWHEVKTAKEISEQFNIALPTVYEMAYKMRIEFASGNKKREKPNVFDSGERKGRTLGEALNRAREVTPVLPDPPKEKMVRPPAVYSNKSREDYINEVLSR
jgi:hypothetical protein